MSKPITAYPRCQALNLAFVSNGPGEYEGFCLEELAKVIPDQVEALNAFLADKHVFCCGHRTDPNGPESHCVYAADLEAFLEAN